MYTLHWYSYFILYRPHKGFEILQNMEKFVCTAIAYYSPVIGVEISYRSRYQNFSGYHIL